VVYPEGREVDILMSPRFDNLTAAQVNYLIDNIDASQVWAAIPAGIENAVTRAELVKMTGVSDREVRRIIAELNENGFPVCSIEGKPGGYYVGTPDDVRDTAARLKAKSKALARRASGLENSEDLARAIYAITRKRRDQKTARLFA
jgi:hypothetical protein